MVVIDVHEEAAKNPDYALSIERVKKWEKDYGAIPGGAFVAMCTDWSKRWPDAAKMENKDANGVAHYPGWRLPVLKYLYGERKVTAFGHETTDTDPGIAASKGRLLARNLYLEQQPLADELLTNLDQVPEADPIVVVSFQNRKVAQDFRRGYLRVCRDLTQTLHDINCISFGFA